MRVLVISFTDHNVPPGPNHAALGCSPADRNLDDPAAVLILLLPVAAAYQANANNLFGDETVSSRVKTITKSHVTFCSAVEGKQLNLDGFFSL